MRIVLYNHRREPFHAIDLVGELNPGIAFSIALEWHAPYYTVGRGRRLVPTIDALP